MKRRQFIKASAATCCGAALGASLFEKALGNNLYDKNVNDEALKNFLSMTDYDFKKLADTSIFIAKNKGASYSDLRVCKNRNQRISTRENRVDSISDREDLGFGVRVLINGTWGFASSAFVNEAEVGKVTELACEIAKANSILQRIPVE